MKNLELFNLKTVIPIPSILRYLLSKKQSIDTDHLFMFIRMDDNYTNELSDFVFYVDKNSQLLCMKASTKAGHYWVQNPISYGGITGTAVLKEGEYINTHKFVKTYRFGFLDWEAIQIAPVTIYRDGNRDKVINRDIEQTGYFGINVHTSGWTTILDRWTAGCQVVYKPEWNWFTNKNVKENDKVSILLYSLNELKDKLYV